MRSSPGASSRRASMAVDLIRTEPPLEVAQDDGDVDVELTLGLSLGGSSRKAPPRVVAAPQSPAISVRSGEEETEARRFGSSLSSSSFSPPPPLPLFLQVDGAEVALDPQRQREIHALRRQEARKKREQKQQKKGGRSREGAAPATRFLGAFQLLGRECPLDDRVAAEAQEHQRQVRVRDRDARRDEEAWRSDRRAGKSREECLDSVLDPKLSTFPNPNRNPNADADPNPTSNSNYSDPNLALPFGAHPFPLVAMQYPYTPVQYLPMANGFGIPCVMPCWAPAMSPAAEDPKPERNVFHPVACRTFQPFSPPVLEPVNGGSPLSSNAVESNDGKGTRVKGPPSSTASQGSSSSPAGSDHQSSSLRGGSSGNGHGRSHPRHAPGELQSRLSPQAGGVPVAPSDNSVSSRQIEPEADVVEKPSGGRPSFGPSRCVTAKSGETASMVRPIAAAERSTTPRIPPPLLRMPCVSTTGNGPNGKTITGILYRYSSTEVTIVCVCHGSSFSPAEFVRHAGGNDVTHPLKQITVVSACSPRLQSLLFCPFFDDHVK